MPRMDISYSEHFFTKLALISRRVVVTFDMSPEVSKTSEIKIWALGALVASTACVDHELLD